MNDNPHVPVNQNGPQEEDEYEVLPILAEQDEPLQVVDDEALPPPAAQEPPRRGATPAAYEPPRGAPTQAAQEPPRGVPTQAAYEPPPPPVRSRPPRPRRNRVTHLAAAKDCLVNATSRAKIVLNKLCANAAIVFVVGAAGHADHILEGSVGVEEISPVWSVGGIAVPGDVPTARVVGQRAKLK